MASHPGGYRAGQAEPAGTPGGHDLIIRAEQALLGAVMSDPAHQAWLLGLILPSDLARPYHRQVLTAMQRLAASGANPEPAAVRAELAADPELPRSAALDGGLIISLLQATPRPGHAPAYAAMVIEYGIRQDLHLAASRLAQAAEPGDLPAAVAMFGHASRTVQACTQRRDSLPEPVRRFLLMPLADDRAVPAAPSATNPLQPGLPAEAAGRRMLQDLTAGAHHLPRVRRWLRPAHFASPAHARTYALICGMHTAGQPVDPVTVAWAAARSGLSVSPANLDGGTAAFAIDSAREVRRLGLLARTAEAAQQITTATADPRKSLAALLRDAAQQLRSLDPELDPRRPRRAETRQPPAMRRAVDPERPHGEAQAAEPV